MTSEDGGSGLRGLNGQGVVTNSSPLQDSLVWDEKYLADSTFGDWHIHCPTSITKSSLSIHPNRHFARVYWDGDSTAPKLLRQMIGNGSEIHSMSRTAEEVLLQPTNQDPHCLLRFCSDSEVSINLHGLRTSIIVHGCLVNVVANPSCVLMLILLNRV